MTTDYIKTISDEFIDRIGGCQIDDARTAPCVSVHVGGIVYHSDRKHKIRQFVQVRVDNIVRHELPAMDAVGLERLLMVALNVPSELQGSTNLKQDAARTAQVRWLVGLVQGYMAAVQAGQPS